MLRLNVLAKGSRWSLCLDDSGPVPTFLSIEPAAEPSAMPPGSVVGALKMAAQAVGAVTAASAEAVAERSGKCLGCEHFDLGRCTKCGCYLWPKIRVAKEKCPDGRWDATA